MTIRIMAVAVVASLAFSGSAPNLAYSTPGGIGDYTYGSCDFGQKIDPINVAWRGSSTTVQNVVTSLYDRLDWALGISGSTQYTQVGSACRKQNGSSGKFFGVDDKQKYHIRLWENSDTAQTPDRVVAGAAHRERKVQCIQADGSTKESDAVFEKLNRSYSGFDYAALRIRRRFSQYQMKAVRGSSDDVFRQCQYRAPDKTVRHDHVRWSGEQVQIIY